MTYSGRRRKGHVYAGCDIFAQEMIIYTIDLSCGETGALMHGVMKALAVGDVQFLRSLPFVGRLYRGWQRRAHMPSETKRQILTSGKCAFCGSLSSLVVDHIKPWSKGGTHDLSNLQCLCSKCNSAKSDHYEEGSHCE